jgi:hypothetical protein
MDKIVEFVQFNKTYFFKKIYCKVLETWQEKWYNQINLYYAIRTKGEKI